MDTFKIITDTTADLPEQYLKEHEIDTMFLPYLIEGVTHTAENEMPWKEFYDKMREGAMPTTSQVNPQEAEAILRNALKENKNILCIAFSSGLSGTYNNMKLAADIIQEEMDDVNIIVVDSLAASLGEGMMVDKAVRMRANGKTMEETAEWLENNKMRFGHVFTVDDLNHLYRGGRVSKTTAFVGTLANIKPILHVDEEGHLIPIAKVRGRKKSLLKLIDLIEEKKGNYQEDGEAVFISHGDCLEEAEFVASKIKERLGIERIMINVIGPTIGTHTGPGVIAMFFMGESR